LLHNFLINLHHSHILKAAQFLVLELPEKSRSQTGYFFELAGKMSHAAIIHHVGNLGEIEFIIQQQLLYPFNFVRNNKMFNRDACYFRKQVGQVSIVMTEPFTQKILKI